MAALSGFFKGQVLHSESFESFTSGSDGPFAGWVNAGGISFTVNSGSTPTGGTGPSGAYEGSKYAYTESTNKVGGVTSILESPALDAESHLFRLALRYHLAAPPSSTAYSSKSFRVEGYDGASWIQMAEVLGGSNGWKLVEVDSRTFKNADFKFRLITEIEGVIFSDAHFNDCAVDSIKISKS